MTSDIEARIPKRVARLKHQVKSGVKTGQGRSPAISVVVSQHTHYLIHQRAANTGKLVSEVVRDALEEYFK